MPGSENGTEPAALPRAVFATTHWSVVLEAASGASPQAASALEHLCRTYWYPLYAYVRRCGYSPEDAQDLTQDFFAHLLAKDFPRGATPEKGKFRCFLLASLRHFLVDQHRYLDAAKRGGSRRAVSLDESRAEERFRLEPSTELMPETLYEREWARTLLERAQSRLDEEYRAAGKAELYEWLKAFPLAEKSDCSFQQVASKSGLTISALKSAVHRMRARYRQLVREEVMHTVANPEELQEEVRHLIAAIGG